MVFLIKVFLAKFLENSNFGLTLFKTKTYLLGKL